MAIPGDLNSRFHQAFEDTPNGPALRSTSVGSGPGGSTKTTITSSNGDAQTYDGKNGTNAVPINATTAGELMTSSHAQGMAAHDAAATGNPLLTGAFASATAPSNVQTGDAVRLWSLLNGALAVYNAYANDEDIDSMAAYTKEAEYATVTASGVVSATPVALVGYFCSASTSGVCTLYDNATTGSGAAHLLSGKTVAANELVMLPTPIKMQAGLYFALGSGSATVRIYYRKLTTA